MRDTGTSLGVGRAAPRVGGERLSRLGDALRVRAVRERSLLRVWRMTPAGAVRTIALITLGVTLVGGTMMYVFDHSEFPTIGSALWWAAQTVTTVGYGDTVPESTVGRIVALYVMLAGVGFLTMVTAAVSAGMIAAARREAGARGAVEEENLEEIRARLERIEAALLASAGSAVRPPAEGMDRGEDGS